MLLIYGECFLPEHILQCGCRAALAVIRESLNGRESGFFGGVCGWRRLKSGFEVAIDADIDVLIKTGIAFEAGFGLLVGFENTKIMLEEADSPFDANVGIVVLKGMGTALRHFDDFAVGDAGSRPCLGEMVGIELVQTAKTRDTADDDVLAVFLAYFVGVHHSAVVIDTINGV